MVQNQEIAYVRSRRKYTALVRSLQKDESGVSPPMIHCVLFGHLWGHISLALVRRTSVSMNPEKGQRGLLSLFRGLWGKRTVLHFPSFTWQYEENLSRARTNIFQFDKRNIIAVRRQPPPPPPPPPPRQILIIFSCCGIMSSSAICSSFIVIFSLLSHPLSSRFRLRCKLKFPLNIQWFDLHVFELHYYVRNSTAVIQPGCIDVNRTFVSLLKKVTKSLIACWGSFCSKTWIIVSITTI